MHPFFVGDVTAAVASCARWPGARLESIAGAHHGMLDADPQAVERLILS